MCAHVCIFYVLVLRPALRVFSFDYFINRSFRGRPTVHRFLWGTYRPAVYYYEVWECIRKLFLTGLLVYFKEGTSSQVRVPSWGLLVFGCRRAVGATTAGRGSPSA